MAKNLATLSPEDFIVDERSDELNSLAVNFYITKLESADITEHISALRSNISHSVQSHFAKNQISLQDSKTFDGLYWDSWEEYRHFFVKFNGTGNQNNDTIIIQCGISSVEDCKTAWQKMREIIKTIYQLWKSILEKPEFIACKFLGYTLIYKSNIVEGRRDVFELDNSVLELARPLFNDKVSKNIISQQYDAGNVFLIHTPYSADHDNGLVYLSLGVSGTENRLFIKEFYQPNKFMVIDKYFHKACFQWLQIKTSDFRIFEKKISLLADTTTVLLKSVKGSNRQWPRGKEIEDTAQLMTEILAPFIVYKRLELSIEIQKKNLELISNHNKHSYAAKNAIYAYHIDMIAAQSDDCRLSLNRAEIILEQTKSAINLVEAQQAKLSNEKSSRLQLELGIIGACLGFIQVFDSDMTIGFLKSLGIVSQSRIASEISWPIIFFTKLIFTAIVALSILIIYKLIAKRKDV